MFTDGRVVEASKDFVKIIIRRPHAYSFRQQHPRAPIPGIAFLDADGKLKGTFVVPEKDAATKLVEVMSKMK